jgi:hypothetical protein
MESVKARDKAWREERKIWWEGTSQTIREKYQGWLEIMDGVTPKPIPVGKSEVQMGLRRWKIASSEAA